jgi:hypothetical protein
VVAAICRASTRALRRLLFSFPRDEVRLSRRGFRAAEPEVRSRLESIGLTFLEGYHLALEADRPGDPSGSSILSQRLERIDAERRGWAFEGAGMALAVRDRFSILGPGRWRDFTLGAGESHPYLLHVGAGWAAARLKLRLIPYLEKFDSLLRWLVVDGYGFHQGYFHWRSSATPGGPRKGIATGGYSARAYDQGLGRSLWFSLAADQGAIAERVRAFEVSRQADLWSGVGLAAAYAGAMSPTDLRGLARAAGPARSALAQGAVFAAKARERAGNPAPQTSLACEILAGADAQTCARIADESLRAIAETPDTPEVPRYERWRQEIIRRCRDRGSDATP